MVIVNDKNDQIAAILLHMYSGNHDKIYAITMHGSSSGDVWVTCHWGPSGGKMQSMVKHTAQDVSAMLGTYNSMARSKCNEGYVSIINNLYDPPPPRTRWRVDDMLDKLDTRDILMRSAATGQTFAIPRWRHMSTPTAPPAPAPAATPTTTVDPERPIRL